MPFTLAHPAAILPFRYLNARYTSLSALVIGSMSPDFVYFFNLGVGGTYSHSIAGLFRFCLPASLIVYAVFYLFLRQPMIALMPHALAARLDPRPDWLPHGIVSVLVIAGSSLTGAATHIVWDAFTHANTLVVGQFDVLRAPVILFAGTAMPLYKVLQHVSSVLGLLLLGANIILWTRRTPRRFARPDLAWGAKAIVHAAILVLGTGGAVAGAMNRPARTLEHVVFNGVVSGMATMMLALLAYCAYWQLRSLRRALLDTMY